MKKVALYNLGCKVNAYEADAMQEMLEEHGYEVVPFGRGVDIYIINTCTVTNMADRKSRQIIHRARRLNPGAVVVAAGCHVQAGKGEVDGDIDLIIGNNQKKDLISILEGYGGQKKNGKKELPDMGQEKEYEELHLSRTAEHTRAFIKVQDGCNQFCSYCIIPYARGRARSRRREQVLEEIERLAVGGCREIVLTGIHLSSYGMDTGDDLLSLIRRAHEVEGIGRIRLGSLEPGIITPEFVGGISGLAKLCPHFHLSLQSGCGATLERMNRRYRPAEYREKCKLLRQYFGNPALTTDVIVGFPGETEEEFAQCKAFVDEMDFYETHIFQYSRREGTKAAAMPGQVPEPVKAERSAALIALSGRKQAAYENALIGTVQEILVEGAARREDGMYQVGHTREYVKIGRRTEENLTNQFINVEIESDLQIIR